MMTAKEAILSRSLAPTLEVEIPIKGAAPAKFVVPIQGAARVGHEKRREVWAKEQSDKPNPIWVQKGLIPDCGFDENTAMLLFIIADFNAEGWSQEDVLEMFNANPGEVLTMASAIGAQSRAAMDKSDADEFTGELGN